MKDKNDNFIITSLSRGDLESEGYNIEGITNEQMEYIAEKMADSFLSCCYWDSLKTWADNAKIKRLKK